MTRRRFYASPSDFDLARQTIALEADETRHLRDVLRLGIGDEVYVFDGQGREFRCTVYQIARHHSELHLESEVPPAKPESQLQLNLGIALLKGEKFDLVVQKATELGVSKVTPVVTRYADVRLRDESDGARKVNRWQRIALEAAKQSGRAVVPQISLPLPFAVALDEAESGVMFSERGGEPFAVLANQPQRHSLLALVGSEGGWSDEEIETARARNFHIVTLGGRVLRAETAAITVAALLQHTYGDLK